MIFCALALLAPAILRAQSEDSRPMLERLNIETQSLYRQLLDGAVRVQLPPPKVLNQIDQEQNPLQKFHNLDPAVRARIEAAMGAQQRVSVVVTATTQASGKAPAATQPAPLADAAVSGQAPASISTTTISSGWQITRSPDGREMILEPRQGTVLELRTGGDRNAQGEIQVGARAELAVRGPADAAYNSMGILLDDKGYVLVPQYVERDAIGENPVKISIGGQESLARFVGSDSQTMLTLLKLDKPAGQPLRLADDRPAVGALVMLISPATGAGRLVIWTGNMQDYGLVASIDGSIAGFSRYGQFFSARACRPVIDQLVRDGRIHRPAVGLKLVEVPLLDPPAGAALDGPRTALRVTEVIAGSAAQRAGVRAGDLVLALEDEPVGDPPTFAAVLTGRTGPTSLGLLREGKPLTLTLELPAK